MGSHRQVRQIEIGFEDRQDLVISKSVVPGSQPACGTRFCGRLLAPRGTVREMSRVRLWAVGKAIAHGLGAGHLRNSCSQCLPLRALGAGYTTA